MKNYWKMTTAQLEEEAARHHIAEYVTPDGIISRRLIIEQLIAIENARNMSISRWAMVVSLSTAAVNIILTIGTALLR
ncbi:MAG TPA: hypothetical protein VE422_04150 [Terriglobia bacterium]|nr:hypothetical protein [Terriglobia bacterium]